MTLLNSNFGTQDINAVIRNNSDWYPTGLSAAKYAKLAELFQRVATAAYDRGYRRGQEDLAEQLDAFEGETK